MRKEVHSRLIKWISDPTTCTLKTISSAQAARINTLIKEAYIQEIFATTNIKKKKKRERKRALDMSISLEEPSLKLFTILIIEAK